jgi:hypothetical protein
VKKGIMDHIDESTTKLIDLERKRRVKFLDGMGYRVKPTDTDLIGPFGDDDVYLVTLKGI